MSTVPSWLTEFPPPAFVVTGLGDSALTDLLWQWETQTPGLAVRVCRGRKMRTVRGLYDEFAAAFQFPWYFGENANAFDECLSDLSWLPAKAYLVCITHAGELLAEEDGGAWSRLFKIFRDVAAGWASAASGGLPGNDPAPFHVLLQAGPGGEEPMQARLSGAGFQARLL